MRKEVRITIVAISLILVLSISLVSAGWLSDFFNNLFGEEAKITGRAAGGECICEFDIETDTCEATLEEECAEGYEAVCDPEVEGICGGCFCELPEEEQDCGAGVCCNLEPGPEYGTFISSSTSCPGTCTATGSTTITSNKCSTGYKPTYTTATYEVCEGFRWDNPAWGYDCSQVTVGDCYCKEDASYIHYTDRAIPPALVTDDYQYRCTSSACGGDAQKRRGKVYYKCAGTTSSCSSSPTPTWLSWETIHNCSTAEKCSISDYECHTDNDCIEVPGCNDQVIVSPETCDDGGNSNNDGCSADCQIEDGWECEGAPSVCTRLCGNGVEDAGEDCDDNNIASEDGCSYPGCSVDQGFECDGFGAGSCTLVCGNSELDGSEACDDGNPVDGDGCTNCIIDNGWTCTADEPSVCTQTCGNSEIDAEEECDDNNFVSGDGCSANCVIEDGYICPDEGELCTDCDEDDDNVLSDLGICGGTDCDDDTSDDPAGVTCPTTTGDCDDETGACAICRYYGAPEICGDGIDQDCDGEDLVCSSVCTDGDEDGYGDPASSACDYHSRDCNDADGTINPGATEICGDNLDNNCNDQIDENCDYYSILELKYYKNTSIEDAEIPLVCLFEVMDEDGDRILTRQSVLPGCIVGTVDGDDSKCSFVSDSFNSQSVYYRSVSCEMGSIGIKKVRCAVNQDVCAVLAGVGYPSSEPSDINVTSPVSCPDSAFGGPINILVKRESDIESDDYEAGDVLSLDLEFSNAISFEPRSLLVEARLYEINSGILLFKRTKSVSVTDEASLEWDLSLPSTINGEGNYRLYLKMYAFDEEDEVCEIKKYDLDIDEESGADSLDFDLTTTKTKRVRGLDEDDVKTFTLGGEVEHSLRMDEITSTSVTFTISSDPVEVTLDIGETESVDLDGDGDDDLKITLFDILSGKAILDFESLQSFEECTSGSIRVCGADSSGTQYCISGMWGTCSYQGSGSSDDDFWYGDTGADSDDEPGSGAVIWILVGVLAIGIIIMVVLMKKKISKIGKPRPAARPRSAGPPPYAPPRRPPRRPPPRPQSRPLPR